uniref:Uncharacterized protein n=1 Tax=viral metagenome TaxID=1070528 RepID=A0A6C0E9J2_9ZZZZ
MELYIDNSISFFDNIQKNKRMKYTKRYGYANHINGAYIDFYINPYDIKGQNKQEILLKFNNEINKAMTKINKCQRKGLYLSGYIINIMIKQIDKMIEDNSYWTRWGFDSDDITEIYNIYNVFRLFLKIALDRIPKDKLENGLSLTKNGSRLYEFILLKNTSLKITAEQMQNIGIEMIIKYLNEYKQLTGREKIAGITNTNYTSYSEFRNDVAKMINTLYNVYKKKYDNKIILLHPTKIRIRDIANIKINWSNEKAYDRTLYLNSKRYGIHKKETIFRLCSHDIMLGALVYKENLSNSLKKNKVSSNHQLAYKGVQCLVSGWSKYSEFLAQRDLNISDKNADISLLESNILDAIRIIVDTGLHSDKVKLSMKVNEAKLFYKMYTEMTDDDIEIEITRILTHPGTMSCSGIGYKYIKNIEGEYLKKNNSIEDFVKWFLNTPVIIDDKFRMIENNYLNF